MAPRNVKVTFANGETTTFQGIPADVTPEQVTARAVQEFPDFGEVVELDGGNSATSAPEAPQAAATPPATPIGTWDNPWAEADIAQAVAAGTIKEGDFLQLSNGQFGRYQGLNEEGKRAEGFLDGNVGYRMMSQDEVRDDRLQQAGRDIAAERRQGEGQVLRSARGVASGLGYEMLGSGPLIEAGIDKITGSTPLDYWDQVNVRRGMGQYDQEHNPVSSTLLGRLPGAVITALVGGGAVRGAGAATSAAGATRTGNAIQSLATLERGTRANRATAGANAWRITKNIGRLGLAGGAQSGAVALANDQDDVLTETAIGAATAPVAAGIMRGVGLGIDGIRALRRGADEDAVTNALQNIVEESPQALAARQAQMSQDVGRNVPLAAALRDDDFAAAGREVVSRSPEAVATAQREAATGLNSFMNNAADLVARAGRQAPQGVGEFAERVTGSTDNLQTTVGELRRLRNREMGRAMAPIRNAEVNVSLGSLSEQAQAALREVAAGEATLRDTVREALRNVGSEAAEAWGISSPLRLTLEETDVLRQALRDVQRHQSTSVLEARRFGQAADALEQQARNQVEGYAQAVEGYAANSRVIEGFETASAGTRRNDVKRDLLRNSLQTEEGQIGQALGELYRQRNAASGNMSSAMQTMRRFAERGDVTRPLSAATEGGARHGTFVENVGSDAAETLARTADVENRIVDRLTDTERLRSALRDGGDIKLEDITYGATLLGGNSLASTRARFMARLLNKVDQGISPQVAENLTEMLFSSDPAQTQRAITALASAGVNRSTVARELADALPTAHASQLASGITQERGHRDADSFAAAAPETTTAEPVAETVTETEVPISAYDSEYFVDVEDFYRDTNPEFLQFVNENLVRGGTVVPLHISRGPEAAALAGVEWDEEKYLNDEAYNLLIGAAYLDKLLGELEDTEAALAAYSGG